MQTIDVEKVMKQVRDKDLLMDLKGVSVHCYLVQPTDKKSDS